MVESLHTWLRTSLEISVLRLLFGCINSYINSPNQSLAQFTLKREISLWDRYYISSSPSYNLNLPNWIFVVAQNNLFMILIERIATLVFTARSLSDFTRLIKRLYSPLLMFNNLAKLTKVLILAKEHSMQQVFFHFNTSMGSIKTFSYYKKLWAV